MSPAQTNQEKPSSQTQTINMRVQKTQLSFIDAAAKMKGKTRTDFILEAAQSSAENAFLDRTFFHLDEEQWEAVNAILDAPAQENPQLAKILHEKAPWE